MPESTVNRETEKNGDVDQTLLRRRGVLAAAWAAVAGLVVTRTSQPVEATAGGGTDGNLVLGSNFLNSVNTTLSPTLVAPGPTFSSSIVFDVETAAGGSTAANLTALYGHGKGIGNGVMGVVGQGAGVDTSRFLNAGVVGINRTGVDGGNGVLAEIPVPSTANAIAVYGLNNSSFAGPGPGAGGFGVYGLSAKGHGLVGATAAAGGAAVVGATNGVVGAYAGAFYGPVVIGGDFTVVGGAKSAAVPHPDGSHRRLYCVESTESWFEDVGKGQLDCGQADVTFDPDFAAVVNTDDYHVFLTEYGQHSDLFVTEQTPAGFRVQAAKEGAGAGAFSWRLVAKRKDIVGERLAKVEIPREPQLPALPDPESAPDRAAAPTAGWRS